MPSSYSIYKRLIACARPYWGRLAIGIIAGFLVGAAMIGTFYYTKNLIRAFQPAAVAAPQEVTTTRPATHDDTLLARVDDIQKSVADKLEIQTTTADGRMTRSFLLITLLGLPFFIGLKSLSMYTNQYFMRWVGARVVRDVRDDVYANLQRQSLSYHGKADVGDLISRCTNDIAQIERAVSQTIADLTRCPIEVLASVGFVVYASASSGLMALLPVLAILFVATVVPVLFLARYIKIILRRALEQIGGLISRMQETLTGIRVVKAFHMEEPEIARFRALNRFYFKSIVRAVRFELAVSPTMEFVGVIAICLFAIVCYQNQVTLVTIGPVGFAAYSAYRPLKKLAKINVNIQRSIPAAERIFELLDLDMCLPEAPQPKMVTEFKDRMVFDHVSLRYSRDEPWIIDDINFQLERGKMVAFVGETGSGKTTVANLAARFYDPEKGRILLDGTDVRDIEIASLRRLVGMVNQETILFNDTIANNIAYGSPEATMEDIITAAKQANAHEFIIENPGGYERHTGEKGFVLSGGQRQRIAIARAILRNPPILILDEATSALDTVTERLVQEALTHLMENRTVFAIAHRLSTIKHADQIFLLDKGRIVERGTHDELYAQAGRYRHLCDIQFS